MSDDLIQLLSEPKGSRPPVHPALSGKGGVQGHLEPEDQSKPQRHQKLRLQPDGRPAVVNRPREKRFEPSAEMLDVRKDIKQARFRVARAYHRLTITGNGTPDFRSLEKFRGLVRKATLLENKYKDMEIAVHRKRQDKREAASRQIGEEEEKNSKLMTIKLDEPTIEFLEFFVDDEGVPRPKKTKETRTIEFLDKIRAEQRAHSEARKEQLRNQRREQREFWRQMRMASKIVDLSEKAKDALAEGLIELDEFRGLMKALDTDPLEASADAMVAGIISIDDYRDLKAVASL